MMAARNDTVAALSARTRADRQTAGLAEADGIALHDGTSAGTGNRIVTRRNDPSGHSPSA